MPAPASRSRSCQGTRSRGISSDTSQNNPPATKARIANSTMGSTPPSVAMSLHTTTLIPKITYAAAHARWPMAMFLSILTMPVS